MGTRLAIICVALWGGLLWSIPTNAASMNAVLVDGMMDFFDFHTEERLTDQERAWIRWGANHEGNSLRQLQRTKEGERPTALPKNIPIVAAREWMHDAATQSHAMFQGVYTWEQAVFDYANGDRQRAYEGLGHVLRIIEDASTNGKDDSYWKWMRMKSPETIAEMTRTMRLEGAQPVRVKTIDAAYDAVAKYADPLMTTSVEIEEHEGSRRVYAVARDADGALRRVGLWMGNGQQWSQYDAGVLGDRWNMLAPVVIRYGASVIGLYREESSVLTKKVVEDPAVLVVSQPAEQPHVWRVAWTTVSGVIERIVKNASYDIRLMRDVVAKVVASVPAPFLIGIGQRSIESVEAEEIVVDTEESAQPELVSVLPFATSVPLPLPLAASVPVPIPTESVRAPVLMEEQPTEEVIMRVGASVEIPEQKPIFEIPASSSAADAPVVDIQGFPIGYMPRTRSALAIEPELLPDPDPTPVPEPPPAPAQDPDPVGSSDPTAPSDDGAEPDPPPAPPPPLPAVIEITQTNFQGGAAVENIVLTNTGGQDQGLLNWTLSDNAATPHTFTFGAFTLAAGASVTVHTGVGTDTATDVYWNRGSSVWNDGGDTATLKDAGGVIIDSETW